MSKENLYLHLVIRIRKVHVKDGGIFTSFTFIRKFFKSAAFKRRRMSGSWYFSRIKFKNLKIVNLWQTINRTYHLDTNISFVKLNVIFRDMELKMEKWFRSQRDGSYDYSLLNVDKQFRKKKFQLYWSWKSVLVFLIHLSECFNKLINKYLERLHSG